jgi:hypothetical protein
LLPGWTPNQLRGAAATDTRRPFGLDMIQVVLGHANADESEVCGEQDLNLAAETLRKID